MKTLKEQKRILKESFINTQGLGKEEKLKAILHNTTISVKLDQIEGYEKKSQNIINYLYDLAVEKGITKRRFIQKNQDLIFDTDGLQLIQWYKEDKLEKIFQF